MQLIGIEGRVRTDGDRLKTKGDNRQTGVTTAFKTLNIRLMGDHHKTARLLSPQTQNHLKVVRGKVTKHKRFFILTEPPKKLLLSIC